MFFMFFLVCKQTKTNNKESWISCFSLQGTRPLLWDLDLQNRPPDQILRSFQDRQVARKARVNRGEHLGHGTHSLHGHLRKHIAVD